MKIHVSTNGCEVGQLYSMHVQQFFLRNDPSSVVTEDPAEADLVILYACGLTESTEKDSLLIINALKSRMKPSAKLVVWGCLAKVNPKSLSTSHTGPIFGPSDLSRFEEILRKTTRHQCSVPIGVADANVPIPRKTLGSDNPDFINDHILYYLNKYLGKLDYKVSHREPWNPPSSTFFVRVAEGCTSYCTYCSEHLVWGKVKSRPIEKVISEFETGLQKGYNRFFLCAEDFGAYGVDIGTTACDLLRRIVNLNNNIDYRVIINEMSPQYLKAMFSDFVEIFESGKIETLGCQVESGSDRILRLMGRRYTAQEWRKYMLYINKEFPDIRLATHFMVGFPTETDEDFEATLRLLDYPLFLKEITIFKFSGRPTLPASRMSGQISQSVKELRFRRLRRKFLYMYSFNTTIDCARSFIRRLE
jgi:MiaB/RimO family radical SAM methylthiotransferase